MAELGRQKDHLEKTMQQDRNVSMSVGVIMERYHLSSEQAYAMLRQHARSSRCKLVDIAGNIIQAMDTINQLTPGPNSKKRSTLETSR